MKLNELAPSEGAKKDRKRVGRGNGSGHGTYSGRGSKGQKSRSGGAVNPRFEGGQIPLVLRLPHKRGFKNIFREGYHVVNVGKLGALKAGSEVTPGTLVAAGFIKDTKLKVKLLGDGEIPHSLSIKVHKWTASAQQKVEAAGGSIERLSE